MLTTTVQVKYILQVDLPRKHSFHCSFAKETNFQGESSNRNAHKMYRPSEEYILSSNTTVNGTTSFSLNMLLQH